MHDVVVGALVRRGRVLLVHRSPTRRAYPDVWDLPGGHRETGESELDALARELREELGVQVATGSASHLCRLHAGRGADSVLLSAWLIGDWQGTPTNVAPDEHDEIQWFRSEELPALAHAPLGPVLRALGELGGQDDLDPTIPDVDARTQELRAAHDVLAPFYAERLADAVYRMPVDRAVLDLFAELVVEAGLGAEVADVGCGPGRLAPYLAARGLSPRGVDLSTVMVETARRDHPGFAFDQGDVRDLPFADSSLAGVVCWYSLMYLPPEERPQAFGELFRVVWPGGFFTTAFKAGDGSHRRGGHTTGLGIAFDIWWLSPDEMTERVTAAGFETVFWAGRPADDDEGGPQGFLVARKP